MRCEQGGVLIRERMRVLGTFLGIMVTAGPPFIFAGWQELKLSESGQASVWDFAVEAGGIPWVMANNTLYYWASDGFREPAQKIRVGTYLAKLVGGGDRGLYATEPGERPHQGRIYELSDGAANYVTDFYHETRSDYPRVHVAKSGMLVNWGTRFVAAYVGGDWKRIEAVLDLHDVIVLEAGGKVYLYYNKNLYSVDERGQFEHKKINSTLHRTPLRRIHGCLWGKDRMFLMQQGSRRMEVFDLKSGKAEDTDAIMVQMGHEALYDCFGAADGAVWVLVHDSDLRRYVFCRIGTDGSVKRMTKTARLYWENTRCWQYKESILSASDGSIWFGTPRLGVARYGDNGLEMHGWKVGLSLRDCRFVFEGENRVIYAASYHSIYRYDPAAAEELPGWMSDWEEYVLASGQPIRDSEGRMWMFLADRPGKVSRWDGRKWHDFEVTFNTNNVRGMMADDQGHILVDTQSTQEGCFDISDHGIRTYRHIQDMLREAVGRGAKHLSCDPSFEKCVILEGGKIWFGYRGFNHVWRYDGARWDRLVTDNDFLHLFASPKYGALLRGSGDRYYYYDRGQFVDTGLKASSEGQFLIGSQGMQPYEASLYHAFKASYVPVERTREGELYLLVPPGAEGGYSADAPVLVRGVKLGTFLERVMPAWSGGHWTSHSGRPVQRLFGLCVMDCNWRETPLLGRKHEIQAVLEDRARNLWIDAGSYGRTQGVFMKRPKQLEIGLQSIPQTAGRSLKIPVNLEGADGAPLMGVFHRVDEGAWEKAAGEIVRVDFAKTGVHIVEIRVLDGLGAMAGMPLRFDVNAVPVFPETIMVDDDPFVSWDVVWAIPAKVVPSGECEEAQLFYRFEGGEWKAAYRGGMLVFEGIEAGVHRVEVAACEEGRFFDPSPVVLEVEYLPEYLRMVESRMDALGGNDAEAKQAAFAELRMAGPGIGPAAETWMMKVEQLRRAAFELQRLRSETAGDRMR